MLTFQVEDMTCGHCVRAIKEAVRLLDAGAAIDVDLGRKHVRVQSDRLSVQAVHGALMKAGYTSSAGSGDEPSSGELSGCCGCAGPRCACAA
jgi:copper chaperone